MKFKNSNIKTIQARQKANKELRETDKPTVEGIISEWWNTQVCNGQGHDLGVLVEIALNRSEEYWRKVMQG